MTIASGISAAQRSTGSWRSAEIDRIDQLAKTPEASPVRMQHKARQVPDLRLVLLLPQRSRLHDLPAADNIGELLIQPRDRFIGQPARQAHDQLFADPARLVV